MSKKLKAELLSIQGTSKDRMLHPATVVSWAKKHPSSALHRQFEWNNNKAAGEYRLWQARRLIQINIVSEDGAPQIVSLSFDRTKGGGYRSVDDVLSNRDLSEIMLRDALAELQRVQARFQIVKELTSVWTAVRRVRQRQDSRKVTGRKQQLAKAA